MINAFRIVEKLEKAGFTNEEAKASVEGWIELMDQNFATKADFKEYYFTMKEDLHSQKYALISDINEVRTELKNDIQELRTEVKAEIQELRTEVKAEIQELRDETKAEFKRIDHSIINLTNNLKTIESKIILRLTGAMIGVAGLHLIIYGMIK